MSLLKLTVKVAATGAGVAALGWVALWTSTRMPDPPPGRTTPVVAEDDAPLALALERHVQHLANGIGERNDRHPEQLVSACEYVQTELARSGWRVTVDRYQTGNPLGSVVAEPDEGRGKREILLLSAPYDSPVGSRGAESSASAVAALIELARLLRDGEPILTPRVADAYGHQPMEDGSSGRRFALRRMLSRGDPIAYELEIESLGAWRRGRHGLPFPWSTVLRGSGESLYLCSGFDGRARALELGQRLRDQGLLSVELVAGPAYLPLVGWGDQASVLDQGPPRVLLTDGGRWRNPDAGGPMDDASALDFDRMARAVRGLAEALVRTPQP